MKLLLVVAGSAAAVMVNTGRPLVQRELEKSPSTNTMLRTTTTLSRATRRRKGMSCRAH